MKKRKFKKKNQEKKENKVERKRASTTKEENKKKKNILHISYHRLSATYFLCGHRKTNCYSLLASNFSCIIFEATSLISLCPT